MRLLTVQDIIDIQQAEKHRKNRWRLLEQPVGRLKRC